MESQAVVSLLEEGRTIQSGNNKSGPSPFLKWAGGKSQLLPELRTYIPAHYERYFEPFLGGGALYFGLRPKSSIVSDANFELIHAYRMVATRVEELIKKLSRLQKKPLTEKLYYQIRDQNPKRLSPVTRAVRTIFLNKTCYNGLYRVNKDGRFNVPFGKYDKMPKLFDASNLREASALLGSASIELGYYNVVLREFDIGDSDFVYLDPPYAVENGTASRVILRSNLVGMNKSN
jgi:DNA adenine methylase